MPGVIEMGGADGGERGSVKSSHRRLIILDAPWRAARRPDSHARFPAFNTLSSEVSYEAFRNGRDRVRNAGGSRVAGWREGAFRWQVTGRLGTGRRRELDDRRGCVQATGGKGGHLVSKEQFGDFELTAEFWVESPETNSGILSVSGPIMDQFQDLLRDQYLGRPSRAGFRHRWHRERGEGDHAGKDRRAVGHHRDHSQRAKDDVAVNGTRTAEGPRAQFARGPIAPIRRPWNRQVPERTDQATLTPQLT